MRVCLLSHSSRVRLFATVRTVAHQAPLSMDSPGKNTGVGCHALLRGVFPTQRRNPRLYVSCILLAPPGKPRLGLGQVLVPHLVFFMSFPSQDLQRLTSPRFLTPTCLPSAWLVHWFIFSPSHVQSLRTSVALETFRMGKFTISGWWLMMI